MKDQVSQVFNGRDRVDALPEQVAGVHLGADVSCARLLDQSTEGGRIEHQVLRMHLDADLHLMVAGPAVDLPARTAQRHRPTGIREMVEIPAVPGVYVPMPATDPRDGRRADRTW